MTARRAGRAGRVGAPATACRSDASDAPEVELLAAGGPGGRRRPPVPRRARHPTTSRPRPSRTSRAEHRAWRRAARRGRRRARERVVGARPRARAARHPGPGARRACSAPCSGFALVVQVRQTSEADLGGMRQADLVRILDETTTRGDALAPGVRGPGARAGRPAVRLGPPAGGARRPAAQRRDAGHPHGPAAGRGARRGRHPHRAGRRRSSRSRCSTCSRSCATPAPRRASSTAQRITASSAFTGIRRGGRRSTACALTAPYRWTAIGDPDTIAPALQIPGGALAQVRSNGGAGDGRAARTRSRSTPIRDAAGPRLRDAGAAGGRLIPVCPADRRPAADAASGPVLR